MGGVKTSEATSTSTAGKVEKPSKWRLFHGKTSSERSSKPATVVVEEIEGRPSVLANSQRKKRSKKSSKVGLIVCSLLTWFILATKLTGICRLSVGKGIG